MDTVKSADGSVIAYDRAGDGPALIVSVGAFCTRQASAAPAGLRLPDEMPGAGAAAQGFRQTRYVLTFNPGLPDSAASGNQPADQSGGSS
jgi:hypothetical protein